MEDDIKELEILRETIDLMKKTQKSMCDCASVTELEYQLFGLYLDELEDRAIKLEIKAYGCRIEEA